MTVDTNDLIDDLTALVQNESKPFSPDVHFVKNASAIGLFVPNKSQFLTIEENVYRKLKKLVETNQTTQLQQELFVLGLDAVPAIDDTPLKAPPLHAISLAISQKCNMGCLYCYAEQGSFGGAAKSMSLEMAYKAIDTLLKGKKKGDRVQISFLGGEPLMNRSAIVDATNYAYQKATEKRVKIGFSITTNGTLVRPSDADFFEKFGFAVTISIDGVKDDHDALRPLKNGKGTYDQILKNIKPLLKQQQKMQVSARVTVTPSNLDLANTLSTLVDLGFYTVGFSPLLNAINGKEEMDKDALQLLLKQMISCGLKFEEHLMKKKPFPFLNMINAFKEIKNKTHRPYPCGAGAGYMGVSAEGELVACHRFVNEPKGAMGNIQNGINTQLQNKWLAERHVHQQSPCKQCWARYLCGGGCHHEVIEKGRPMCDYIRGWLHYTLQAYERIHRLVPEEIIYGR